jgi:two-component system copper resistance phosphate regulon response regulator CusR
MERKRILIIDDEEDFCSLVKTGLETRSDFEVSIATNGKDGIDLAKVVKPDLILLDITMPEIDGFQVLERLKKDKVTVSIPVIMLTAREDVEYRRKASQLFNEAYLTKPVEFSTLKATIEDVLRRRGKT